MATNLDFIEYVCDQISGVGIVRYRKMFGEYMIYVDNKPVLLVCDNTIFVKILDVIKDKMAESDKGLPYDGAKEHYILDVDDSEFAKEIIYMLLPFIKIPKPKKKRDLNEPKT